jgi:hypothetical protein
MGKGGDAEDAPWAVFADEEPIYNSDASVDAAPLARTQTRRLAL